MFDMDIAFDITNKGTMASADYITTAERTREVIYTSDSAAFKINT